MSFIKLTSDVAPMKRLKVTSEELSTPRKTLLRAMGECVREGAN